MLDGIRVLDLTRLLPGAYATLLLADLGADVIKIEAPEHGDPMRQMPPVADGTGAYFTLLNRNKRSVTLDLRQAEAADIVGRLVERCDVAIDSFRPKTARRFGVDAPALLARNPRLVCASISGFGQGGPYADVAAHDINYQALAGLLAVTASGGVPQVPPLLVADLAAAFQTTIQVLAALVARQRAGAAAPIALDISIHEAAMQFMVFPAARHLVAGADADPREVPLRGQSPRYNVYRTADGKWLALGALEAKFWDAFCQRIGRPDLAAIDERPAAERARAVDDIRALISTRTREAWLAHFADADACLTPVLTVDETRRDPHVVSRGLIRELDGISYVGAEREGVRRAPRLGEHTDEVLESVGIGTNRREELRRAGVI
jgi:crotonobetainyl-CoA:carnitine CoA-transferase CaiB-like acyl-CoA transferase